MKKRKRLIWVVASATLLAVFVGALFYLATREHPDFTRAAAGLPEARKEAEDMFGPLSWEEWRAENGIDGEVDLELWLTIADSIPPSITDYSDSPSSSALTRDEIYQQEREWFDSIDSLTSGLRARYVPDVAGEPPTYGYFQRSGIIVKAIAVGVVAAADGGDVEGVMRLGRSAIRIIEQFVVEPSSMFMLFSSANTAILSRALAQAAVRNRHDQAVQDSVRQLLSEIPAMPSLREFMGCELRALYTAVDELRSLDPDELAELLSVPMGEQGGSSIVNKTVGLWEELTGEEVRGDGRTGPNTMDALETLLLKIMVRTTQLMEAIEQNDMSARASLKSLHEAVNNTTDRATALTFLAPTDPINIDFRLRSVFSNRALLAACELIDRFPDQDDLPDELPQDLQFPDPFGGEPAHYLKTEYGFMIYTIGPDYDQSDYQQDTTYPPTTEARFTPGMSDDRWAFRVSYDPRP